MIETFVGWVPSVTGRLSFSQIGNLSDSGVSFAEAYYDEYSGYVFCIQDRTKILDDSIYGIFSAVSKLFNARTVFELDAIAPAVGDEFPELIGTIRCHGGRTITKASLTDKSILSEKELFKVRFKLKRCGQVRLFGIEFTDLVLNYGKFTTSDKSYLYAQCYIFLKDMVHRHRHHDSADDTFVEMRRYNRGWKKGIAFQLMRRIIKRPIKNDPESFQEALGVLAYLKSFQSHFGEFYKVDNICLLYTSPSPRDQRGSRMPSSA